jgi:MFS transporter, CP family, cyanate transporter
MTQRPAPSRLLPTALALFLIALALRPQVVAIGPLLPAMRADLAISHALGGLVAAIPVLCMGIFALLGPWLGRRLGTERAIAVSVGAIVLFGLLRSLAPEPLSLVVLTFGVGVGIGVVGPLLPQVVQKRASRRAVIATGIYAGGIVTGATLSSALAVPLAGPELNWRVPLAVFSLASLGGLAAWLWLERPGRPASEPDIEQPRLPWRHGRAWLLALLFGAQSILFYAANSWLPTIYVERGWPEAEAGLLVGLMNGISLVGTFAGPALADRLGSRRGSLAFWASGPLVGFLGVVLLPQLTLLWVVCLGIGLGAIFPLVLTLPVDFAGRAGQGAGGLAAIMLFGGYVLAAAGPLVFGLLRDATGAFTAGLWLMVAVAVAKMALSWWLVPADLGSRSSRR